jgi:hypothetical protein
VILIYYKDKQSEVRPTSCNGGPEGVGGQRHAPAALSPGKVPTTCSTGGWVGPKAGLEGCRKSHLPPGFNPRTVQPVMPTYQRTHIFCCILNWEHSEIWNFVLLCQYGRLSFAVLVEYSQTFFKSQNKTWISLGIMFRVFHQLTRCAVISTRCKCICLLILTALKMTTWVFETCRWLLCSKITFIHLSQRFSNFFQVGTTFISQNVLQTNLLLSPLKANLSFFKW